MFILTCILVIGGTISTSCKKDRTDTTSFVDSVKVKSNVAVLSNYSESPLISNDRPWENGRINYSSVAKVGNKWYIWYEAIPINASNDFQSRLCVATSSDGLNWTKPELSIVPYNGQKSNILIDARQIGEFHAPYVFYDAKAPDSTKFKLIFVRDNYSMYGGVSADGIHWNNIRKLSWGHGYDSQNMCIPTEKGYKYFLRSIVNGRRTISTLEAKNFDAMSMHTPKLVQINPIPEIKQTFEYYTPHISTLFRQSDSLWVGFPSAYFARAGAMQPHLILSKDGMNYEDHGFLDLSNSILKPNMTMVCMSPIKISANSYWLYFVYINNRHHQLVNRGSGIYRVKFTLKV